jgi:hypothetical protein
MATKSKGPSRGKWASVTPGDYDLEFATDVERAISVQVENGLRAQVLRIRPTTLSERRIKRALEQTGSAKALVWTTERYVYAAIFHEE